MYKYTNMQIKNIHGVCRICYKVKKYRNVKVKKISIQNLQIYTCADCLLRQLPAIGRQFRILF
jgi:hypothetical protein